MATAFTYGVLSYGAMLFEVLLFPTDMTKVIHIH